MAVRYPKPSEMDTLGKIVALCLSVLFFLFTMWYIVSRRASNASDTELLLMDAMFIVLAGPIAYFFVNAARDQVSLSTWMGKIVLGGGYAVAVAALLVPQAIPGKQAWRCLTIKNSAAVANIEPIDQKPPGSIFSVAPDEGQRHKFICYFAAGVPVVSVEFMIDDGHISRPCNMVIRRSNELFADVDLVKDCSQ